MKSTELSTALEIGARHLFGELVRTRQPWRNARRKDRAAAFHHCWQIAVGQAALDLALPDRDAMVQDLQRQIPGPMLETHVGRDSVA